VAVQRSARVCQGHEDVPDACIKRLLSGSHYNQVPLQIKVEEKICSVASFSVSCQCCQIHSLQAGGLNIVLLGIVYRKRLKDSLFSFLYRARK